MVLGKIILYYFSHQYYMGVLKRCGHAFQNKENLLMTLFTIYAATGQGRTSSQKEVDFRVSHRMLRSAF